MRWNFDEDEKKGPNADRLSDCPNSVWTICLMSPECQEILMTESSGVSSASHPSVLNDLLRSHW